MLTWVNDRREGSSRGAAGRGLLAALYHPVWTSAIKSPADYALGLAPFALLVFWKLPPWLVVLLSALGGWVLALLTSARAA